MAQGYIYKFTLETKEKKKVEVERKNKETGEIETIIQNKTVKTPTEFVIKKPSRRLVDEAEAQYAIELSKNIKKGIITKNMLVKKYADTGGQLTENEAADMVRKLKKSNDIANEIQLLTVTEKKENKKKIEELQVELLQLRQELADLELSMQGVYGHTADARAERSMLLWYTIQLCKVVEEGKEKSFFDGLLYEDQLENLYDKDEEGTLLEKEALQNFMAAISYWFYNNSADQEAVEKFIESSKKNV
jgi:Ca2+-binding EF-hand superfamily protein